MQSSFIYMNSRKNSGVIEVTFSVNVNQLENNNTSGNKELAVYC